MAPMPVRGTKEYTQMLIDEHRPDKLTLYGEDLLALFHWSLSPLAARQGSWLSSSAAPHTVSTIAPDDVAQTSSGRSLVSFKHKALKRPNEQIRLLKIDEAPEQELSQNDQPTIRIRLSTWALEDAPKYAALSYTWGTAINTLPVSIGGDSCLNVTRNCAYALWQLHQHCNTYIWIDAICIDQTNNLEKNAQVNIMHKIYNKAEIVYSSLGQYGPRTSATTIHTMLDSRSKQEYPTRGKWLSSLSQELVRQLYQCAIEIATRQYWSRAWIIQEFALAKVVVILFGPSKLQWKALNRVIDAMSRYTPSRDKSWWPADYQDDLRQSPLRVVARLNPVAGQPMKLGLRDCLEVLKDRQCSDARDRIFSTLSIVEWPSNQSPIQATYDMSCPRLAVEALDRLGVSQDNVELLISTFGGAQVSDVEQDEVENALVLLSDQSYIAAGPDDSPMVGLPCFELTMASSYSSTTSAWEEGQFHVAFERRIFRHAGRKSPLQKMLHGLISSNASGLLEADVLLLLPILGEFTHVPMEIRMILLRCMSDTPDNEQYAAVAAKDFPILGRQSSNEERLHYLKSFLNDCLSRIKLKHSSPDQRSKTASQKMVDKQASKWSQRPSAHERQAGTMAMKNEELRTFQRDEDLRRRAGEGRLPHRPSSHSGYPEDITGISLVGDVVERPQPKIRSASTDEDGSTYGRRVYKEIHQQEELRRSAAAARRSAKASSLMTSRSYMATPKAEQRAAESNDWLKAVSDHPAMSHTHVHLSFSCEREKILEMCFARAIKGLSPLRIHESCVAVRIEAEDL